ncbi:MAG: peptidoglycan editing factor PgeF [Bacteroidota bacterium]|nr:peptidoglycan editing factor PgeF [Candidatus Kapabacteria bacterium]MCS7302271.1 peptidoglycan editing factor PgeF [Candidatus Kapabacteria bacterium]MDW8271085.1 peptidoglycan editing factor PgeF [Bacteroidota bacterium]
MTVEMLHYRDGSVHYGITLRNAGRWSPRGWTLQPAPDVSIEHVRNARDALARQLGFDENALVTANQVHGSTIAIVDRHPPSEPADGLITARPGVLLCISVADCCAVLLWDLQKTIVAALHSGWRGTAVGIVQRGVQLIEQVFGIPPAQLRAWLSPCASGKRYVVGRDVAQLFPNSISPLSDGKFLFDNAAEIRRQLLSSGLREDNITGAEYCTISDERFHSYRRDGAHAGRMAAFIGILPQSNNSTV